MIIGDNLNDKIDDALFSITERLILGPNHNVSYHVEKKVDSILHDILADFFEQFNSDGLC